MEYEHRGTKIVLDEQKGTFLATIAGKRSSAPSLAALKARIDKTLDGDFKPFTALVFERYGRSIKEVTVTAVKAPRKGAASWNSKPEWVCSDSETRWQIIEDTPENRAAIKAWDEYTKESERIARARAEEKERLWSVVTHRAPQSN